MSASAERREPIDLEEFERRLRAPETLDSSNDPLADLARLVAGQGRPARDPFASIFSDHDAPKPPPIPKPAPPESRFSDDDALPDLSQMMRRGFDEEHTPDSQPYSPAFRMPPSIGAPSATPRAPYMAPHASSMAPPPVEAPKPDQFHESAEYEDWADDGLIAPDAGQLSGKQGRSRRPLYLTAGVIVAGFVMIGGSLAWRGGSSTPAGISIIKAASGPTKVQPEGQAATDTSSQGTTMLDKSATTPTVKKVVTRGEAPMDVSAAEKLPRVIPLGESSSVGAAAIPVPPVRTSDASPAPAQVFPEPKKVKTVAVRADGTIISSNTANAPALASPPRVMPGSTPPAKNATPKSDTRAAATPAPMLAGSSTAAPAPRPAAAKPAPKPPVTAKPTLKQQVAAVEPADDSSDDDASPAKAAASAGGGYAVQLAAPGSEGEARQVAQRLGEKYSSQLGGRRPSVVKASDKAVYRVRVGGMSREAATGACERIKAAGGACFVAR